MKPAVLQTEVHPYSQEKELKAFLSDEGIVIQAWYPLGHGDKALQQEPLFTELAKKYGKSNAQIILRWHIQSGNIVIPGSKNPEHIKANLDLFDFALTDEEMAEINAMDKKKRYYHSTPEMLKKYAEMVPAWTGRSKAVRHERRISESLSPGRSQHRGGPVFQRGQLPHPLSSEGGVSVANVTFEPGCRNNWHIHHKGGRSSCVLPDGATTRSGAKSPGSCAPAMW